MQKINQILPTNTEKPLRCFSRIVHILDFLGRNKVRLEFQRRENDKISWFCERSIFPLICLVRTDSEVKKQTTDIPFEQYFLKLDYL